MNKAGANSAVPGLTEQQERAAFLVAEDRLTNRAIAAEVGISQTTLFNWKNRPEFIALVESVEADIRATVRKRGIADVDRRVKALDDRWRRMHELIEARSRSEEMRDVAGGQTGLMVRTVKRVVVEDETGEDGNSRKQSREVEVYAFDAGLMKSILDHEKQAAQELGQWVDRTDLATKLPTLSEIVADMKAAAAAYDAKVAAEDQID